MIKGTSKRVVYLKNTDSTMFDEAYFVVRAEQTCSYASDRDMIREAERIACEKTLEQDALKKAGKGKLFFFAMGIVCSTLFYTVLGIIFYIV